MSQRRLEKMAGLLRETIADLLLRKSKDPRLKMISITGVKVTPDLKTARVFYSVMGGEAEKVEAAAALAKGAGFVRAAVGESLNLKYAPAVKFEFDRNLEYAQHINEVLKSIQPKDDGSEAQSKETHDPS